jgi:hypothetical protein
MRGLSRRFLNNCATRRARNLIEGASHMLFFLDWVAVRGAMATRFQWEAYSKAVPFDDNRLFVNVVRRAVMRMKRERSRHAAEACLAARSSSFRWPRHSGAHCSRICIQTGRLGACRERRLGTAASDDLRRRRQQYSDRRRDREPSIMQETGRSRTGYIRHLAKIFLSSRIRSTYRLLITIRHNFCCLGLAT